MPKPIDPREQFAGRILIAVPHMDDEALACGGTIALLPQKGHIHLVYATDGMRAPAPIVPWRDAISPDLGMLREEESKVAMGHLGVPEANLRFLRLPEGRLSKCRRQLAGALKELVDQLDPDHILLPFRYDRHVDHLALHHAMLAVASSRPRRRDLVEYFVYTNYRLLPKGDIRAYIDQHLLLQVDIGEVAVAKRAALDRYRSQTTRFYPWQTRPNLTPELLDGVSHMPELFLRYDASAPGAAIFERSVTWIRVAHRLEPVLKKRKDHLVALATRALGRREAADA